MQKKITQFVSVGICALLFGTTLLKAQQTNRLAGTNLLAINEQTQLPAFIDFQAGKEIHQSEFNSWAGTALNLPINSTFKAYSIEQDKLGFIHTRYKQYVNDVPVQGTMVITHEKNGVIESVNGDYFINFQAYSKSAVINEADALKIALNKMNAEKYAWEEKGLEEGVREALGDANFSFTPKGELVIVHKENADYSAASFVLAYKFDIFAYAPLSRKFIYVEAKSGTVVAQEEQIHGLDEKGTANTLYSGSRTISTSKNGSNYTLNETGRGKGILTKKYSGSSTADLTSATKDWTITNADRYALDAHWGAEMSYDYYLNVHGRNSLDDNGIKLVSLIHNSEDMNAYWTGTTMLYGDGNGNDVGPFAALDVCGHELTHGLVTHTASLDYSGEPGALNEGFADIFGTCIEAYARPAAGDHNWIMGTDFAKIPRWHRSLQDPKSKNSNPDTYKGEYWDPNGEVHKNDGPIGHWFYLLSEGGKGTNDLGNSFDIKGIGMAEAEKIAYRALTVYMTPGSTYSSTRTAAIKAATDLFKTCSLELHSTIDAFYAIGVGAKDTAPFVAASFTPDVTTACKPATIKFTNSSINATSYKWDFGDGGTSTDKDPSHDYTAAGTYTVTLTSTGNSCSNKATPAIIKVDNCTGVDNINADNITVFPNPASSFIGIKSTTNITGVQVMDVLGKVVLTDNTAKASETQLNVSTLNTGVYFIRINTVNAQKLVKIVKE
ncbi:MAG TPA: M4 family metallopeptidase [Bacteroidia bacterium]|jgi:Zn-dependent metalloprotease|nr:M4 family metallopeptidase [Bacteroidia bacterium]